MLIAVPWDRFTEMVAGLAQELADKIGICCVNPLGFDADGRYRLVLEESAPETTASLVPTATAVGAFHHVAAPSLWKTPDSLSHEDVLACGSDDESKALVQDLAMAVTGKRGIDAGAFRLARQLERLTAVLISMNKRYKTRSGLAISGNERG